MKIISRGILPKDKIWRGSCRACKSVVEATQGELTHIVYDQREGSFAWERCPVCDAGDGTGYGGVLFYVKNGENR